MASQRDTDTGRAGARVADAGAPRGRIDAEARQRLGRNLRLLYTSVLDAPLPERFTRLLDDLSAAAAARDVSETERS